ncbi:MAG: transposase [Bacteroidetes bacterium]|nr:transposase [Bacteroidota bacterium]
MIDGSKGASQGGGRCVWKKAIIQRCQWHKRENVLSYLSDRDKSNFKTKIQNAYREPDYNKAKLVLLNIHKELLKNQSKCSELSTGRLGRNAYTPQIESCANIFQKFGYDKLY